MGEKYVPSGIASPSGILKTILFGILASFILPIVYILLVKLVPNIWFIAICAMLFGMGLGYFIDLGVKVGKIRNFKIGIAIAIFCGLLAFYNQWVLFDALMYSAKGFTFNLTGADIKILLRDFFFLFTHPGILFQEIQNLNAVGTFRIESSGNVSGLLLWVIWFGELVVILLSVALTVANGYLTTPFSEQNDMWMERRKTISRINFVQDKASFLNSLDNKQIDLLHHNPEILDHENFAEVVVFESYGDPSKYINVVNVTNTVDKKGKITAKKKNVTTRYQLLNANI
ncbi:hypothetical protein [Pedobacter namyangjuensis]|uniref:hypothetical protein n=1 Tax=Pedobacter namyangjuensis TaxID=600626 RepID=UPI000DE394AC|nr:hypothetical protein [Pedobacter namyangjuensis]